MMNIYDFISSKWNIFQHGHLPAAAVKKQVTKVQSNKSRMQIIRCNLSFQFRPSFQTGSLDDNWAIISDNLELQENFQFCLLTTQYRVVIGQCSFNSFKFRTCQVVTLKSGPETLMARLIMPPKKAGF